MGSEIFGVLFEHGAEAVFSIHRQTRRILSANRRLEDMVGRSSRSLVGSPAQEMFVRDDRVTDWVDRILSRAGLHEEVALRQVDDYPVYVTLTVAHVDTDAGPIAACVARDTTERRRLERELIAKHTALYSAHKELELAFSKLRETQERLEERNRELSVLGGKLARAAHRATIGEFSAGIAHSMNNPLGAAQSAFRQIGKRIDQHGTPELSTSVDRFLKRGWQGLTRMESIVSAIRRAHKSGTLESRANDLVLEEELDLILSLFEDRLGAVVLTRHCTRGLHARVPSDALYHVVSNLLDNALKALNGHGCLEVACHVETDCVVVSVSDNGPGIAPEMVRNLFEPFASGRSDGTGLGLCMARRLARSWGGDVVHIPMAKGARFDVTMPTATGCHTQSQSRSRNEVQQNTSGR